MGQRHEQDFQIVGDAMNRITIRQEGSRVLLLRDGKLLADMPWDAALEVGTWVTRKARLAEEYAKANEIALDHAILLRSGAPFGLTNNPLIQRVAFNLAQWDSLLRRRMPRVGGISGIPSSEQVGTPK